jgi:hypothetical protein
MKKARAPSLGASRTSTKGNVLLSPENWFVIGSGLPDYNDHQSHCLVWTGNRGLGL